MRHTTTIRLHGGGEEGFGANVTYGEDEQLAFQAGRSLCDLLEREARPVTFVVSARLGDPSSLERLDRLRGRFPDTRLKLDATSSWTPDIFAELASWGTVDSIDLKGAYSGTPVDQPADPCSTGVSSRRFRTRGSRTRP